MSKHTGEIFLEFGGKRYTLIFDWAAVSELQEQYTTEQLGLLITKPNPKDILPVLMMALRTHHPEITSEEMMKLSPPIFPTVKALDKAIANAWYGAEDSAALEKVIKGIQDKTKIPSKKNEK